MPDSYERRVEVEIARSNERTRTGALPGWTPEQWCANIMVTLGRTSERAIRVREESENLECSITALALAEQTYRANMVMLAAFALNAIEAFDEDKEVQNRG